MTVELFYLPVSTHACALTLLFDIVPHAIAPYKDVTAHFPICMESTTPVVSPVVWSVVRMLVGGPVCCSDLLSLLHIYYLFT